MPIKKKTGFDATTKELGARLKTTLDKVLKTQAKMNLPLVYRNSLCVRENQFIHEYTNGKKYLIQQNRTNSEEIILREF